MSQYDQAAWQEIQAWWQRSPRRSLVPGGVKRSLATGRRRASESVRAIPGSSTALGAVEDAVGGLLSQVDRIAVASVHKEAIASRYRKRGHHVAELMAVRALDLKDVDAVKPRVSLRYTLAAAAEGAGAGAAMSGGELATVGGGVFSAGAAAAPGAFALVGITAADAVAVLGASSRVTAEVAAYYGYDVELPHERLYAAGVLGVGLAPQAAKVAAYQELNKLVQALARRKTWAVLDSNVMTRVIKAVYGTFGAGITQRKLGQAVPVLGIAIGGGLNAKTLSDVADAAENIYRERFLREKYALPPGNGPQNGGNSFPPGNGPQPGGDPSVGSPLDIVEIVETEVGRDNQGTD